MADQQALAEDEGREERLLEALLEAESEARRFLEKALGSRSSNIYLVLRLERRSGESVLVVDARAEGYALGEDFVRDLVDEAIERAFKTFEKKSGMRANGEDKGEDMRQRVL